MNSIEHRLHLPCSPTSFAQRTRRYTWHEKVGLVDRSWPEADRRTVPVWCAVDLRDGNQALAEPMDHHRRLAMYQLLVDIGYKEIEIGFPAASQSDYNFVRYLIETDLIPDDVTIQVITQARDELIQRTFASIAGADRAIVHMYNSVSPIHRRLVFGADRQEIVDLAVDATRTIRDLADCAGISVRYEYTPESFTQTELDFSLEICERVSEAWEPTPADPIIVNLPATVESAPPNVFADQIEWMHRNLTRRDCTVISLHPHNDRGTAVAAAELGYQAGADRIEGCLFGNGERTGNVCLVTLGMNLFSQGVYPMIDFSDIDAIRRTVEHCSQLPVHVRHPWGGDLVYTAFSGGHQDAINKGLAAMRSDSAEVGSSDEKKKWEVPYLPIDPKDVGRTYKAVIRVNSQSGKGGIAYVLKTEHHLDLPRPLQIEFARMIQRHADAQGGEIDSATLWELFTQEYLETSTALELVRLDVTDSEGDIAIEAVLNVVGEIHTVSGRGDGAMVAFVAALNSLRPKLCVLDYAEHLLVAAKDVQVVAYVECAIDDESFWGVGRGGTPIRAALHAVASSIVRAGRAGRRLAWDRVGASR